MKRPPWSINPYYLDRAKERFDELLKSGLFDDDLPFPTVPLPSFAEALTDDMLTRMAYALDREAFAEAELDARRGMLEYQQAIGRRLGLVV